MSRGRRSWGEAVLAAALVTALTGLHAALSSRGSAAAGLVAFIAVSAGLALGARKGVTAITGRVGVGWLLGGAERVRTNPSGRRRSAEHTARRKGPDLRQPGHHAGPRKNGGGIQIG